MNGSGFHTCKQQKRENEQIKTITLEQVDIRLKRVENMLFNKGAEAILRGKRLLRILLSRLDPETFNNLEYHGKFICFIAVFNEYVRKVLFQRIGILQRQ